MNTPYQLTKTGFLTYLDAPLHLWAHVHNRIEVVPSDIAIHNMTQGTAAEKLARQYLKEFILDPSADESIQWQRTFTHQDYTLRVDALIHKPHTDSYDLYEIKSGTSVDKKHLYDTAYQYAVLSDVLDLERIFILHLNKEYIRGCELEIEQLFTAENVTEKAVQLAEEVKALMPDALRTAHASAPDGIPYCYKPRDCPCPSLCHPDLPEYSIYDIPYIRENKKRDLLALDALDIKDVPADFPLNDKQRLIVSVAQSGQPHVDQNAVAGEFDSFIYPLYFLDYESCLVAVPMFSGCWPQQQIAFQYSLHRLDNPSGKPVHSKFLATDGNDPSTALVQQLRHDIGPSGTIFVWNKGFEAGRHKDLAKMRPDDAEFLLDLNTRIYDLGDFVNKGMYVHPDFKGRWSIKKVLPVMVPELSYDGMEIGKGDQAMRAWWKIVMGEMSDEEIKHTRSALLDYCELDTLAMVRIWQKLKGLI